MKTLDKKAIKAGVGYTIGNLLIKSVGFLSIPIFTRLLSSTEYGIFNSYLAYESIVFIIIGFALHSSIKNAKYKYKDKFNEYCSSILLIYIINLIIFLIIGNLVYPFIAEFLSFSRFIFNCLIIQSMGAALITFYNVKLSLEFNSKKYVILAFLNTVGNVLLSIVLMKTIFNNNRVDGRVIGSVIPLFLIGIYVIWQSIKLAKPKYNKEYWTFGMKYSLPIVPHGLSQVILSQFDRVMIQHIISAAAAGIYSFAYNIGTIVQTIATSVDNSFSSWLYEKMSKKEYSDIKEKTNKYVLMFTVLCMVIVVFSVELVKILSTKEYWESIYCVIPIIFATYFMFLYFLPAQVEYYHKKTNYIALGTVFAALLNVLLNYIFIPRYGYIAATYTTVFSYIVYFIAHYIIARKILGFYLYDTKFIIKNILLLLLVCIAVFVNLHNFLLRYLILIPIMIYFIYNNKELIGKIICKFKTN